MEDLPFSSCFWASWRSWGTLGLRQVERTTIGMKAAKDITINILEARREEKNFIIRGGQDYIDLVATAVKGLNASTAALEANGLTSAEAAEAKSVAQASHDYEGTFANYVTIFNNVADTTTLWKKAGDQLVDSLSATGAGLTRLPRVRLAAVYFLKDRTADNWKVFAGIRSRIFTRAHALGRIREEGRRRPGRSRRASRTI